MIPVRLSRLAVAILILVSSQVLAGAADVVIFAASSLGDSLREIGQIYERKTGDRIVLSLAGSGTLSRQIEAGAPADIFFSADETRVVALDRLGLALSGSRRDRLSNGLMIVVPEDSGGRVRAPGDLALPRCRSVALGDPAIVPAGAYARQYLERLGLWDKVKVKLVPVESVRAVLAAVAAGEVEAGIVYRTDLRTSSKVRVAYEVSAAEGPRIVYPVVLLKGAPHPAAARRCLEFLEGPEASEVFRRYGFGVLDPGRKAPP